MRNKKPIIGIITNYYTVESGVFVGLDRMYVSRDYIESIVRAGAIPLLLPILSNTEALRLQIEAVDALVLAGGQDVQPQRYNEEPSPFLETICPERDAYEIAALNFALAQQKPVFGICRGMQLINVAFGGSLYQDIAQQCPDRLQHSQKAIREEASHTVTLESDSWLSSIMKKETLPTNSFHHQAIKELAAGFRVSARAQDGIIEAIEKRDQGFIVGVQWHPEMMSETHLDMQTLFTAFCNQMVK
jgi:putative glutamine amidotransferase